MCCGYLRQNLVRSEQERRLPEEYAKEPNGIPFPLGRRHDPERRVGIIVFNFFAIVLTITHLHLVVAIIIHLLSQIMLATVRCGHWLTSRKIVRRRVETSADIRWRSVSCGNRSLDSGRRVRCWSRPFPSKEMSDLAQQGTQDIAQWVSPVLRRRRRRFRRTAQRRGVTPKPRRGRRPWLRFCRFLSRRGP